MFKRQDPLLGDHCKSMARGNPASEKTYLNTIQPCGGVTGLRNPHNDRLTSFRNAMFPANRFCQQTCAVVSRMYVIFQAIARNCT